MKMFPKATLSILALGFPFLLQAQEPAEAATDVASDTVTEAAADTVPEAAEIQAEAEFTVDEILEAWGWYLGQQIDLVGLALTEDEVMSVYLGLLAAAKGEELRFNLEQIAPFVQEYLASRAQSIQDKRGAVGKQEEAAFFALLDSDPDVVALASGLRYQMIEQGTGAYPAVEDVVVVHYTGTLIDGTVFDSSIPRGEPASFQLNQVIPGWTQGLQKISEGGTIRLYVPADLAYGDAGRPGIPPASTLIFEVKLLEVKTAIPEPSVGSAPGMP